MKTVVVLIYILALLLLISCTALDTKPTQKLALETTYKRDMVVTVNGVTEEGVLVVPMRGMNEIKVQARGDLDMFSLQTCHREWAKEKAWNVTEKIKSGLFGWGSRAITDKRKVEFVYSPVRGIEDMGACPLQLSGYAKAGQHSWAFIDFKTDSFSLQGNLLCNGTTTIFDGVGACQARKGLIQVMSFRNEVFMSPDPGCEIGPTFGKEFSFPINSGICVYRIKDRMTGAIGKVTLIGYDSILIREN